jgi:hypothetical protein
VLLLAAESRCKGSCEFWELGCVDWNLQTKRFGEMQNSGSKFDRVALKTASRTSAFARIYVNNLDII